MRSLLKSLRSRGVRGTLKAVTSYSRNRFRLWIDSSIDRKYGTSTQGIIDDMSELGVFTPHRDNAQGYEAIQIPVFRRLLRDLKINPENFIFIDFGSGKGRALMMAAESGFARVVGVEFSPVLHKIAQKNLAIFQEKNQRTSNVQLRLVDAADFEIPSGNLVCFLYNPFDLTVLEKVITNLKIANAKFKYPIIVAYRNPVHADLLDTSGFLHIFKSTRDYRLYRTQ